MMRVSIKADLVKKSAMFFMMPFIFFLFQCGRQIKDNRETIKNQTLVDPADIYSRYFIQDTDCQANSTNTPLVKITRSGIEQWTGEGLKFYRVNFELATSQYSLNTPEVIQFNYGGKYLRNCVNQEGMDEGLCLNELGNTEPNYIAKDDDVPKPLKICRDNFEYSMDSYEGVALTTLHTIHKVYDVLRQKSNPSFNKLSPIQVDVLPIYESRWLTSSKQQPQKLVSKIETDNLFYLPKNDKNPPKIVIVPEPIEATDKQSRYWAMPFAVAHELGHHFHRTLEKDFKIISPVSLNLGQEFHRYVPSKFISWFKYNLDTSGSFAWTNDQRNSLALFLASIYEGFADLFAFYTLDKNDQSITQIKSLGINRQVSSSIFSSNLEKIYTTQAIEKQIETLTKKTCTEHTFCHYHLVGAIHAHAFEKIVSKFFELTNLKLSAQSEQEMKLNFLKIWFEQLYSRANSKKFWESTTKNSDFSITKNFRNSISKILLEGYFQSFDKFSSELKIKNYTKEDEQEICSIINENYPSLNIYTYKKCK